LEHPEICPDPIDLQALFALGEYIDKKLKIFENLNEE
jgi:hypothetical protein